MFELVTKLHLIGHFWKLAQLLQCQGPNKKCPHLTSRLACPWPSHTACIKGSFAPVRSLCQKTLGRQCMYVFVLTFYYNFKYFSKISIKNFKFLREKKNRNLEIAYFSGDVMCEHRSIFKFLHSHHVCLISITNLPII